MKNSSVPQKERSVQRKLRFAAIPLIIVLCAAGVIFAAVSVSHKFDYVITDGSDIIKVSSYSQIAESVLEEFEINVENATYEVENHDGYTEIIITRTFPVSVTCDGVTETYTVEGGTAASLLNTLGIVLDTDDMLSCKLTDKLSSGMEIKVTRYDVEYETVETVIPFETKYVDSPYMDEGKTMVVSEGENGLMETTYVRTYIDGVLDSFYVESETVVSKPVSEITATGSNTTYTHSYSSNNLSGEAAVALASFSETPSADDENTITTLSGESLSYSKVIDMTATAYTYHSGVNITYSGALAQVGIVAALPGTLPQGTRVYIVAADGSWEYGVAIVGDKPARNILDLFMETYDECVQFGVRDALVYVLD
ncbi:MAG: G5 domain-containing protein [Oscillospiraceae bacterium]